MLEYLLEWDVGAFYWVNQFIANDFFDGLLPFVRDKYFWIPVYFFIISYVVLNYGKRGYWLLLFLLLTVGTVDFVSHHIVKKNVQRIRPCNDAQLASVAERARCGSGYSFTSNHAANHFAMSIFLSLTLAGRRRIWQGLLLAWALIVSFAQVYVGVHYPLDVMAGAILGGVLACIGVIVYQMSDTAIFEEQA